MPLQIIEAENRKFLVIESLNLERFPSEEAASLYLKGSMYLRQPNSNNIHIVKEIVDIVFEELSNIEEIKEIS